MPKTPNRWLLAFGAVAAAASTLGWAAGVRVSVRSAAADYCVAEGTVVVLQGGRSVREVGVSLCRGEQRVEIDGLSEGPTAIALRIGDVSRRQVAVSIADGPPRSVSIDVPSLTVLTIQVAGGDGRPSRNATVLLEPGREDGWPQLARLDETGGAAVVLPSGPYGATLLGATAAKSVFTLDGAAVDPETLILSPGPARLRIITSAHRSVRGRIRDETGQPRAGLAVVVEDEDGTSLFTAITGENGDFDFDIAAETGVVRPVDPRAEFVIEPETIALAAGGPALLEFIARPAASPRLTVTIVDDERGERLAGVQGEFEVGHERTMYALTSDTRGRCAVPCRPGEPVTAFLDGRKVGHGWLRWSLARADCAGGVTIRLPRRPSLGGQVVDEENRPVAGFNVRLVAARNGVRSARTDERGRFVFGGLDPGWYSMSAGPQGRGIEPTLALRGARAGVLPLAEVVDAPVELKLVAVPAGTVCMTPAGSASPSKLIAYDTEGHVPIATSNPTARRDGGPVCVGPLPPGAFLLRGESADPRFLPTWAPGVLEPAAALRVTLERGASRTIPGFELVAGGIVVVELPDAVALGLTGEDLRVTFAPGDGQGPRRALSSDLVRVVSERGTEAEIQLPTGRWLMRVEPTRGPAFLVEGEAVVPEGGRIPIRPQSTP